MCDLVGQDLMPYPAMLTSLERLDSFGALESHAPPKRDIAFCEGQILGVKRSLLGPAWS